MFVFGCGGDDDSADGGGGGAADLLVDSRNAEELVADFELGDAALLQLSDLPEGWKVDAGDDNPAADAALFECLDPPHRELAEGDETEAERAFELGDAALFSNVEVHPSEAYATESFGIVHQDNFEGCYRGTLEDSLRDELSSESQPVGVDVQLQRLPDPALGDESAAFRLEVLLTAPGMERRMVIDVVGFRVGNIEAGLQAIELGQPFDPALLDQLLRLTLERTSTV